MPRRPAGKLKQAAAALFRKEDTAAAANPFLSSLVALANADVEVWPENWPVVRLFSSMNTQWHSGFSGRTGLIYASLYPLLDRHFSEEWEHAFSDIQEMEIAALNAMAGND